MISNFIKMPAILKLLSVCFLVVLSFSMYSMTPGTSVVIFGSEVSALQWWTSGSGLVSFITAISMMFASMLMLRRSRYGRLAYIFSWLAMDLSIIFVASSFGSGVGILISTLSNSLITTLLIILYLYKSAAVKKYFLND